MITTVTPNIALDITYTLDKFDLYGSMRATDVAERAGGKGINVSRVLNTLGVETKVTGFIGGIVGQAIVADLTASGLEFELSEVAGQTRRSVGIVDRSVGDATVINEAGPTVGPDEWESFVEVVAANVAAAGLLVVSGSLAPGSPVTGVGQLAALGRNAGIPVIVDTSGEPLLAALAAQPSLIKPNIHEIRDATGIDDPIVAARQLIDRGAGAVAVSLGADGMAIIDAETQIRAKPPEFIKGNPTGAGDAGVAALAAGVAQGSSWAECLTNAVALSAAAVANPLAGGFDAEVYERLLDRIEIEEF